MSLKLAKKKVCHLHNERGLSLPDITILESLAKELGVAVSEILSGEKGKKKHIDIQKEIDQAIENIKKEQEVKRKKIKKYFVIGFLTSIMLLIIVVRLFSYYNKYHPEKIVVGNNHYSLGSYNLQTNGLDKLVEIVTNSQYSTDKYNVSYLETRVNKDGKIISFTLSLNFFDENSNYVGRGGYTYGKKKLVYTYVAKENEKSLLVDYYSKTSNIEYISTQIKKIPLRQQLKISELNHYVISYRPNTSLEWGTPIFDGQDNKEIKPLSKKDYNDRKGGESDKDIYFVIRLNDGSSIVTGQQYLYVFDSIEEDTPKNPGYMMEVDYFINNNQLKFTRDYGSTWIETDISEEQVKETLNFYGDVSLLPNSWFMSTNSLIPMAYFYGEEPVLKISNDNGNTWIEHKFITSNDISGKPITKRVVGFTSQNFGYVALGTDWTMGSGELKKLYFTYDGGKTWKEVEVPLNGTSHILIDVCMYDENIGVILLRDTMDSNFPMIYSTISGGKSWNEVRYRESNLPDDITYLYDIDSIEKEEEAYFITLGQGNEGTLKATFRAVDMIGWTYMSKTNRNIHTVG